MNRQIKFRAWDEAFEEMIYNEFHISANGTAWFWSNSNRTDSEKLDLPIMQFTGLLDKNGKEIYEGDIVIAKMAGIPFKCYVDYNNHVASFQIRYPQMRSTIGAKETWISDFLHRYSGDIEVVGNIHEMPEFIANKFGNN